MEEGVNVRLRSMCVLAQAKLAYLFNGAPQSQDLHIQPELIKPFDKICGASWLRQQGINKIFKLDTKTQVSTNANRTYLIQSCLIQLKHVLDQINGLVGSTDEKFTITIIIVPKVLTVYETLLEEEGLSEIVSLKQFQWEFMFMDENVISLELPFLFKSVYVNRDYSLLSSVASSLWSLFRVIGDPSIFVSVGKISSHVLEMYDIIANANKDCAKSNECNVGAFLIIDRDQDFASSLLTPATYSGLLYEIFNIKSNEVELNVDNTKYDKGKLNLNVSSKEKEGVAKKDVKMILDSNADSIYAEIKYLHFSSVFSVLSSKSKQLNNQGAEISNAHLSQMKHAISTKLQQVIATKKCLANHILACETIVSTLSDKFEDLQISERAMLCNKNRKSNFSFIDENLCTDANRYMSLKLLCLLTLTQGITVDEYNSFVTKYLHAFGYATMYVFQNLTTAGLVVPPANNAKFQLGIPNISSISEKLPRWQNNFQIAANKLKQLPGESEETTVKEPNCPSYVFNGSYIPLTAALSKIFLTAESMADVIAKLSLLNDAKISGPVVDRCGIDELGERLAANAQSNDLDVACRDVKSFTSQPNNVFPLKPRSVVVFVVGGVTQGEIAACNLVGKLTGGKVIVASDSIVSSEDLMQSAM